MYYYPLKKFSAQYAKFMKDSKITLFCVLFLLICIFWLQYHQEGKKYKSSDAVLRIKDYRQSAISQPYITDFLVVDLASNKTLYMPLGSYWNMTLITTKYPIGFIFYNGYYLDGCYGAVYSATFTPPPDSSGSWAIWLLLPINLLIGYIIWFFMCILYINNKYDKLHSRPVVGPRLLRARSF